MEKTKKIAKITLKALGIAIDVILVLIIVINLYNIVAKNLFGVKNPTFLGISSAIVDTGSMKGDNPDSFDGNTFIVTLKQKSYEIGDIITFDTGGSIPTTHRIVGIEPEGYVTKGDYNNTEDDWRVPDEAVVGKVILILPELGAFLKFLRTPQGLLPLAIILVLVIGIPYVFGKRGSEQTQDEATEDGTDSTDDSNSTDGSDFTDGLSS